jgi:hypothetical protein
MAASSASGAGGARGARGARGGAAGRRVAAAWTAAALAAGLLLPARGAEAGAASPCAQPFVFSGAAVNVVVLPYAEDKVALDLGKAGRQLALLLQLDSLFVLGKYGSLGAVYLTTDPFGKCEEERVEAQLLTGEGGSRIAPGKALVILWGRIYEERGDVYLQSYLRFLRRDRPDRVEVAVARAGGPFVFSGRSPVQQVAFPPRRLGRDDLAAIEAQFKKASLLYREPRAGDADGQLPIEANAPMPYGVEQVRDGWLQVAGPTLGGSRWLKASIDPREWALHQKLPELEFLDAVTGYMRARVAGNADDRLVDHGGLGSWMRWIDEALARYDLAAAGAAAADAPATPCPAALGKVLAGNLRLLAGQPEAAGALYREAARLIPYSADVRNLDILSQLPRVLEGRALEEQLLDALALEPSNVDVLKNLEADYRLKAAAVSASGTGDAADLERQLAAVRKVLAGLEAGPTGAAGHQ